MVAGVSAGLDVLRAPGIGYRAYQILDVTLSDIVSTGNIGSGVFVRESSDGQRAGPNNGGATFLP